MEFTLKATLNASPSEVYSAWLSNQGHSDMTGGEAEAGDQIGDPHTAWDGYISGKNLALEPNKRIVQSWRTTQFKSDEADSQIEILLEETNGGTELTLNHTQVPEDGEHYIKGWEDHYFGPMREYFGESK